MVLVGRGSGISVSGGDRGVAGERVSFGGDIWAKSWCSEVGGDCTGGPERGDARSESVRAGGGGCAVESNIVKLTLSIQNALCNILANLCGPYLERLATWKEDRGGMPYGC
jgi:hypothetical protein